jgi:hypothetical protein
MTKPKHNINSNSQQFYLVSITYAPVLLPNLEDDNQLLQDKLLFHPKSQITELQHLNTCILVDFQARVERREKLGSNDRGEGIEG